MLPRMRHVAWLSLLACASAVAGTVYKSVGPDGAVIYADRPAANAQELRLPEPSTYAPPAQPAGDVARPLGSEPSFGAVYQSVRVTAPMNQGTVFAAQGGVDIDVALEPPLLEGHTLTYVVDGKEMATGLRTNLVRLTDLDRGTHHLEVAVRDEAGRLVAQSERITFHLRQPSVLEPSRREDEPPNEQPPEPSAPGYQPPEPPRYDQVQKPAYGAEKPSYGVEKPSYVPKPLPTPPYAPSYTPKPSANPR
jgi:hypothetical protein